MINISSETFVWRAITFSILVSVILSGCLSLGERHSATSSPVDDVRTDGQQNSTNIESESPNSLDREAVESGEAFAKVVRDRLEIKHDRTKLVSYSSFSNKTVKLDIQIGNETPIYWSMMDTTQTVAATTSARTTNNGSLALKNGTSGLLYEPRNITVSLYDDRGRYSGQFQIDPKMAREYRMNNISSDSFATQVASTYNHTREKPLGSKNPDYYLNRSEMADWAQAYAFELRKNSSRFFDSNFPIENVQMDPGDNSMVHEFNWTKSKYGEFSLSASSAVFTAYWRTTNKSWAKAPRELSVYIHRPERDQDYFGSMERKYVYGLLNTNRDSANLTAYFQHEQFRFVEKDENPLEDDS